ncbi:MAG TPA: YihY/virulence factor BrkB family protein [bacterium]|nr:YihY/virulence factor BrkB family protein [bacterium]
MARHTLISDTHPLPGRAPARAGRAGAAFVQAIEGLWNHGDLFSGAAISFYALFSLLPLVILFALFINVAFPHAHADRILSRLLGGAQHPDILVLTVQDAYVHRGSLGWLGSLTLILAATGVFGAIQVALDRVFECHGRFLPARLAVGVLMMVGSLVIFLGVMVSTVLTLRVIRETGLAPLLGIPVDPRHGGGRAVLTVFPAVAQFGIFWVGYRFLPNVPVRWREAWPGAVIAAVLWQITSYCLGLYIGRVADYTTLYHSLSVIVALLAWIYALACTFLFGAEFVAAYAPRRPIPRRLRTGGIPIPGEGDPVRR